jgi:hypothetical protein
MARGPKPRPNDPREELWETRIDRMLDESDTGKGDVAIEITSPDWQSLASGDALEVLSVKYEEAGWKKVDVTVRQFGVEGKVQGIEIVFRRKSYRETRARE